MMMIIDETLIQQAENSIPGVRFTTAFLGNIPTGLSDDLLEPLLRACGPLRRWKRPLATTGLPKPFGFAEYYGADGLLRCQRLLTGLPLAADLQVSVRLDEATVEYLEKYEEVLVKLILGEGHQREELDYANGDVKAVEELIGIMTRKHMLLGKEHMQLVLHKLNTNTFNTNTFNNNSLSEVNKENSSSSNNNSSSNSSSASKRGTIVLRRKSSSASSIDWSGFEEREQRYLAKEAARLERIQREEEKRQIDCKYKMEKISLFKKVLSEYKDIQ